MFAVSRAAVVAAAFLLATRGGVSAAVAAESSFDLALRYPEAVRAADAAPASVIELAAAEADANLKLASASDACRDDCCDDTIDCGGACGDCNCGSFCCDCGPTWIISAGAVILHRSRPDPSRIVSTTNATNILSSGDDFDLGWAGGPEVSVACRTASGKLWEVRYFGVPQWEATAEYGAIGPFQLGAFNASNPDNLIGRYTSSVHSTEINWHCPLTARFSPLVGFRWVELSETLNCLATYPATTADWTWNENNHLYGGQLGGTFDLGRIFGPVTMTSAFKAGVYGNAADNDFTLVVSNGPTFDAGAADSDVAFVGEINLRADLPITQRVSLYGGYQLLWIDGVALASDEAAVATVTLNDDTISVNRDVFYHGATTGVEVSW
jgi:hypothetical protein